MSNYYKDFYPFDQSVFGRELELTFNVKEYDKSSEPKFDKVTGDCISDADPIEEYPFKGIIDRIDKPYEKNGKYMIIKLEKDLKIIANYKMIIN